jgi:hypothetical protein
MRHAVAPRLARSCSQPLAPEPQSGSIVWIAIRRRHGFGNLMLPSVYEFVAALCMALSNSG